MGLSHLLIGTNLFIMLSNSKKKICVVGLGYVGLPLFLAFNKKFSNVVGFDIDNKRVSQLKNQIDSNREITKKNLILKKSSKITNNIDHIKNSNIYILTLPTPIDNQKKPDLRILRQATIQVSKFLKQGDIIVYESTVYPGLTEEVLIPLIERYSKMRLNEGFFCGYSPERINPGDKKNTITNISKIVSGSDSKTCNVLYKIYKKIIKTKVIKASSIKHAEAAKVIENIQRDVNISLFNELSILFSKIGLSTKEIIKLASTKWNFIRFKPGLVGGHCIGVDPYYLTYKAKKLNIKTHMILAGRKVNDQMHNHVSKNFIKLLKKKYIMKKKMKVLILGFSFKENCSDFRNTQVIKIYRKLKRKNFKVDIYDPLVNSKAVFKTYNVKMLKKISNKYHGIIICVNHKEFKKKFTLNKLNNHLIKKNVIYDLKWMLKKDKNVITL